MLLAYPDFADRGLVGRNRSFVHANGGEHILLKRAFVSSDLRHLLRGQTHCATATIASWKSVNMHQGKFNKHQRQMTNDNITEARSLCWILRSLFKLTLVCNMLGVNAVNMQIASSSWWSSSREGCCKELWLIQCLMAILTAQGC